MGKRDLIFGSLILGIVFILMPLASAEILIGQTDSLYNIGGVLDYNITLSSSIGTSDFLISKIVCDSGDIEIFKSPYSIKPNERKTISISAKLDNFLIKNFAGICYITASYSGANARGQNFDLSRKVNVQFFLDSVADPEKEVKISGIARKSNSELLDGFVEVSVKEIGLQASSIVSKGNFNLSLIIPRNAASGSYEVVIRAYDKDDLNNIGNEGSANGIIRVKQIIEGIDVALNKQEFLPGEDVVYTILLSDQAESLARQEAISIISGPGKNFTSSILVISGEANTFSLGSDYPPGYWNVNAKFGDLEIKKGFYVGEFENVSFSIVNKTLIITNTGNIPLNKPIQISVGNFSEIKNVALGVGAIKKYEISAPDGNYDISTTKGDESFNLGSSFLTGKAIEINETNDIFGSKLYFWMWAIVILLLCTIVIYFYIKNAKKAYYGKTPSIFSPLRRTSNERNYTKLDMDIPQSAPIISKAVKNIPSSVGKKEGSVIVAVKIKNFKELKSSESSLAVVEKIIRNAEEIKARVQDEDETKLFIFSPIITKEQDNKMKALKFARNAERSLSAHNQKYASKIKYGIGVHIGEMIIESIDGKLKFSSLGNTIVTAKKAADKSDGAVLLSYALHNQARNLVKDDALPGENFWKLRSIVDRSEHDEFIQRFMKKQSSK
ncbi:MAG: hypothetical protein AABX07_00800 [Nanoarchaeota archaeon]